MITGIQHFSFTVSNLEETLRFFHDLLGLEATPIREVKGERIEQILQMPGAWLRICNVTTPDNSNLEFIEYVAPKGEKIDLKTCNVGVAHLALEVDDIQKMYDDLTAKGVKFNHSPLWAEAGALKGWGICYLKGPDGITLELMEAPKGVELHPATGFPISE
jgi:catechol 2,3-dioxygenase-like lactoylglutathione lyase family enzyme